MKNRMNRNLNTLVCAVFSDEIATYVSGARYMTFRYIAKASPEVSIQLTVVDSRRYLVSVLALSTSAALTASEPKVSPSRFKTFSARASSPIARKAIFLAQSVIPAATVAVAAIEEVTDGSTVDRLWMKR